MHGRDERALIFNAAVAAVRAAAANQVTVALSHSSDITPGPAGRQRRSEKMSSIGCHPPASPTRSLPRPHFPLHAILLEVSI